MGLWREARRGGGALRKGRILLFQHQTQHFSLTGCGAQFKTAEKDGDGSALILQVYLPAIDGNLPVTTSVSWNQTTAVWDKVNGSKTTKYACTGTKYW